MFAQPSRAGDQRPRGRSIGKLEHTNSAADDAAEQGADEVEAVAARHPLQHQVADDEVERPLLREQFVRREEGDVVHAARVGFRAGGAQHCGRAVDGGHPPGAAASALGERNRQPAGAASVLQDVGGRKIRREAQLNRCPHEVDQRLAALEELAAALVRQVRAEELCVGENREVGLARVVGRFWFRHKQIKMQPRSPRRHEESFSSCFRVFVVAFRGRTRAQYSAALVFRFAADMMPDRCTNRRYARDPRSLRASAASPPRCCSSSSDSRGCFR